MGVTADNYKNITVLLMNWNVVTYAQNIRLSL